MVVVAIAQVVDTPTLPVSVVPVINLTAIIGCALAMGMLINRVKQLEIKQISAETFGALVERMDQFERRINKVQNVVFHEEEPWDGGERRNRPTRK